MMAASFLTRIQRGTLLILSVVLFHSQFTQTSINVDEINSVSYHVDILSKPVLGNQISSGLVMHLTSKYGQEYQCNLPEIPSIQDEIKFSDDPSSPTYMLSDISILLKPLETGPCLVKTKDWWTYEFCYGKYIKQYHLEDNTIVTPVITLGVYESEYDWKNKSKNDETSRNRLQRYHSQYYVNGTKCEVTGTLRRSEVRFLCEEGAGDYISQVNEPESCRYIIMIHTTRVCHHPYLRPPPTNKPHPITCNPVLTSSQYKSYQKQEEEEKKMVEGRRKIWLAKQEERLLALKQLKLDEIKEMESAHPETPQIPVTDGNSASSKGRAYTELVSDKPTNSWDDVVPQGLNNKQSQEKTHYLKANDISEAEQQEHSLSKLAEELQNIGKELENQIGEQTDQVKDDGTDTVDVEQETFRQLSNTLTQLLKQLDKAEKDLNQANEALWNLQNSIAHQDQTHKQESQIDKSEEVVTQKVGLEMEPATEDKEAEDDQPIIKDKMSSRLRLKVKNLTPELLNILKLKSTNKEDTDKAEEKDKNTEEMSVVEQALMHHLQKSGLNSLGTKVEVKIITAGYFNEDDGEFQVMNDDESDQLQTVLVKLLAGNDEATQHIQRQNELEKNYRFVWDDNDDAKEEDMEIGTTKDS